MSFEYEESYVEEYYDDGENDIYLGDPDDDESYDREADYWAWSGR